MTEIALASKLPITMSNSCGHSSLGSQLNTAPMVNASPDSHTSEKSIIIGELETTNSNATLASSFHSSSPPKRIPYVQQPIRPSGGYTPTCHQNVLSYSPQRTASPTNQVTQQHYHHHYNHYYSPHHHHHHYPIPIRQQAAVRHLQEFMLQQWHNFECRNHPVRPSGNPFLDTKAKPYYNTSRYSQSKRDFQTAAESKHVSLPHSLPQGDRNSPVYVPTKGLPGNQMMTSSPAVGETWGPAFPYYRRKLMSSSGNLSPTQQQQQSLRHSGSVDTMTWQRGYSIFQKNNYNNNNNNNNSVRLPPVDIVGPSGPRFASPARGHSAGSSSGSSGSGSGSGCRPSHHQGCSTTTGGGDDGDRTAVQVPSVSAGKDRHGEMANRCAPTATVQPHTILSRRPPDLNRTDSGNSNDEDKGVQLSSKRAEPCCLPAGSDETSSGSVERASPATTEDGDRTGSPPSQLMASPVRVDSQRPTEELVVSITGDGLACGEHFWTPDPPASPTNTVAPSNEAGGHVFGLAQLHSSASTVASAVAVAATLDSLNDVD